ncbi:MAG: response regulator, partial [Candidatus Brocadiaceae bacterium]|nr:response regulator [Candidatus Brocadiaceae bacterium]
LSILVVDDEREICNILDRFLSESGNKVISVDNGADALKLINSKHFDLVLCDLAMPNVLGYDVIKAINGLANRPKVGIITGCEGNLNMLEEYDIKVDFVINKPFDLPGLSMLINDAFGLDRR